LHARDIGKSSLGRADVAARRGSMTVPSAADLW
jgi:hypothetical protein